MSNHCHFIISAKEENLSDVIRDMKKFTSKTIYNTIVNNPKESRKKWLSKVLKHNDNVCFWKEGYHGEEVLDMKFYWSKADYIHQNPVKSGIVEKEEEYLNSSAGDFHGVRVGALFLSPFG